MALLLTALVGALGSTPVAAHTVVFSDGFESGTLASWSKAVGAVVQSTHAASGAFGLRLSATSSASYVLKQLASPVTNIDARAQIGVLSRSTRVKLLQLRTTRGAPIASIKLNGKGQLCSVDHITGRTLTSLRTLGSGTWHQVGLRVRSGGSGTLEVTLDGVVVSELSATTNLGTVGTGRIQIGDTAKFSADLVVDDVTVSDVDAAPDTSPPSAPTVVKAKPITPTRVDITWKASTDNRSVAGYEISRNGAVIGFATSLAFSDVWATPTERASYTVVAIDPDGNRSSQSAAADASPPAAPDPGTILAADGFDRPDGPLGTADTGQDWKTDANSTWGVEAGRARVLSGKDPGKTAAAVELGVSDHYRVEADITLSPTPNRANVGLSYHYAASNMHMWAKLEVSPGHPEGLLTIGKQDPTGTTSLLASAHDVGLVNGATYHARVDVDGATVQFTVSGGTLSAPITIGYTLSPTEQVAYMGGTAAGLRIRLVADEDDGQSRWDRFAVTAL